jgi:hypothetical protein
MIGNAVPVNLAKFLANSIKTQINHSKNKIQSSERAKVLT